MTYRRPLNEPERMPFAFEDGARWLRILMVTALIAVFCWALGSIALEYLALGTALGALVGFIAGVLVSLIGFCCLIGYAVDQ